MAEDTLQTEEQECRRLKYDSSEVDPLEGLLPWKDEPLNQKETL